MPTFEELALHTIYPVLHVRRKDDVTIVATRVPMADVRLQQWGWILTQAYTTEQAFLTVLRAQSTAQGEPEAKKRKPSQQAQFSPSTLADFKHRRGLTCR